MIKYGRIKIDPQHKKGKGKNWVSWNVLWVSEKKIDFSRILLMQKEREKDMSLHRVNYES